MNVTRTRTARKVIGSRGIIGAAAAVTGLGTFGTFSDGSAPLDASVATGTLPINLTPADDTGALSLTAAGFVPGDSSPPARCPGPRPLPPSSTPLGHHQGPGQQRPVVSNNLLPGPAGLTASTVDHLVATLTLPTGAGTEFQGLSSAVALTFSGTQANGTAR